jgi:ribosomal protein S18 acetylase RimI-like enzyme
VCGFASPGLRQAVFMADPTRLEAVVDELLMWLRGRRTNIALMTFAGDVARAAAFERHGLRLLRSMFSMVRPDRAGAVPAWVPPGGVEVAPYRLGEADESVHRLIYVDAEWASVPGHGDRDLDAWREKERPCQSMFLARHGGRPIGWVAARMLDNGRGYISTLAVAAGERGRGLGGGLLARACADLQAAGAREITLLVLAENAAALGLYRSLGFELEREWRTYAIDV